MRRIAVVGTSGSGKTTFAAQLADRLGLPHVELDALFWEPGWVEPDLATFRARVSEAIAPDGWVLDGNYSRVRDLYLARADTIVWLDLPLWVCLWRVARRAFARAHSREELWGSGNRESWRKLLSRDSLVWWVIRTHNQRRRENEARFTDPAFADVEVLRFRSSAAVETWLAGLRPVAGGWS
jgi:adenylate kinase family enzyme